MPDEDRIAISDLSTPLSLDATDVIPVVQGMGGTPVTVGATVGQMASKTGEGTTFSNLETEAKNLVPAINELLAAIADVADEIPENGDFSLSGLSDTQITSPSSNQILSYDGNEWKNVGLNSLMPTTITAVRGSTMSNTFPLPNVSRRGNVCIINFAISLPAGTYNNSTTLWEISPKPVANTRAIVNVGGVQLLNVLTDGTIKFNSNVTLSSSTYILGQAVFLTDG